jgi:hypothetical protein
VSGEAPGGEGKTCPGCGGLGWIPAGDEQAGCIDCNGTGHAPAPPSTAPAAELKRRHPGHDRIGELESLLRECNAALLAALPGEGPAAQAAPTAVIKESLKPDAIEAAEERGREEVWGDVLDSLRAVYGKDMPYDESPCELIVELVPPASLPPEVEAAAEDVVRGDWWGHYCPSCGSTSKHGPECRIGRLAKALSSASGAKGKGNL